MPNPLDGHLTSHEEHEHWTSETNSKIEIDYSAKHLFATLIEEVRSSYFDLVSSSNLGIWDAFGPRDKTPTHHHMHSLNKFNHDIAKIENRGYHNTIELLGTSWVLK